MTTTDTATWSWVTPTATATPTAPTTAPTTATPVPPSTPVDMPTARPYPTPSPKVSSRSTNRALGLHEMGAGIVMIIIGLAVSLGTFAMHAPIGVVFFGPIIYGAVRFARGVKLVV